MTFPRVSRRERHFANVGDVIIYPDLVVPRTDGFIVSIETVVGMSHFSYIKLNQMERTFIPGVYNR